MHQNPDLLKLIGQDPAAIERELKKDEEYDRLLQTEANEIDNEAKEILQRWIEVYRIRLWKDYENRKEQDETLDEFQEKRKQQMIQKNPKFVLRNHLAEACIKKVEKGDYEMLEKLLYILENPFDEHEDVPKEWSASPPKAAYDICVSCSS